MARPTAPADPRKLDVERWCRAGGTLDGALAWPELPRLSTVQSVLEPSSAPGDEAVGRFQWSAEGLFTHPVGREPQWRLQLRASGRLRMTCQRCLQPMLLACDVSRLLRFVLNEQEAETLDESSDDEDVLVLSRSLDVCALVEDELILALPIVPRHQSCPVDLAAWMGADEPPLPQAEEGEEPPVKPFAALAALKR
jgi:uncharacterized protein